MKRIWMGIEPEQFETRILAMAGPGAARTLLKARLALSPASRRALPALLEAIALWQGAPVDAALVVGPKAASSGTSLYRDCLPDFGSDLYCLEYVEALRRPHRRDDIAGMGRFEDLRQLVHSAVGK